MGWVFMKKTIGDLAVFGGDPVFDKIRPVSNLARPDIEVFLSFLKKSFYMASSGDSDGIVTLLEKKLASFHEVPYCVTFNSGFWALAAAMSSLAKPGLTEVVMPSLTYRRMADIAGWVGLKPHFCEVDPLRLTNTVSCVAACINEQTALVLGVHPVNGLADIDGLTALALERGIPLIFDSVESVYEVNRNCRIGSFGEAEVFSLGASKLINGFEGGYVTTASPELAEELRAQRSGMKVRGRPAVKAPISEVHAAMALASLQDIDAQVLKNRNRYLCYQEGLKDIKGLRLLEFSVNDRPGYKNIMVEVLLGWPLSREQTVQMLNAEKILARSYYPQPLHTRDMGYPSVMPPLPITEKLANDFILLPCGEQVSCGDIEKICELLVFVEREGLQICRQFQMKGHV